MIASRQSQLDGTQCNIDLLAALSVPHTRREESLKRLRGGRHVCICVCVSVGGSQEQPSMFSVCILQLSATVVTP